MLGSWFSSKSTESVNKDGDTTKPERRSLKDVIRNDDPEQQPAASSPTAQPPPVPSFSTPHDEILANLLGGPHDRDPSVGGTELPAQEGKEQASPTESTPGAKANTNTSIKLPFQELREPFTGALLGTLVPLTEQGEEGDVDIDAKEAELWAHHAQVLALQTELAHMHLDMESIGEESRRKTAKGTSTRWGQGGGGEEDVGVDDEEKAKKAREEEFESLPGRFTGRQAAIDDIMNKLGDLSDALKAFHALQMPHLNLGRPNNSNTSNKSTADNSAPSSPPTVPPSQNPPPHKPTFSSQSENPIQNPSADSNQ